MAQAPQTRRTAGIPEAAVVDELMLLRDGARVAGYLGDPAAAGGAFLRGCQAVIRARGLDGST